MIRRIAASASLALVASAASAGPVSVSCDSAPGGIRSLVVEAEGRSVEAEESEESIRIEVDAPGEELAAGALRCDPARAVQVIPGRILGTNGTRVLVSLGRERPRIVRASGRVRLLWLPETAARETPGPASAAPASPPPGRDASFAATSPPERAPAPERAEAPAPAPAPRREPPAPRREPPAPPVAADPRPRQAGAPQDFLPLEKPVTMVATMATESRSGAGRRFPVGSTLEAGARVTVDGRAGDWLRMTSGAWVFGPYFEAPEEALAGGAWMGTVQAITSPVHAGPGPHHEVVAELYRGEKVVIDEVRADWAHVRDGGWVRTSELSRSDAGR